MFINVDIVIIIIPTREQRSSHTERGTAHRFGHRSEGIDAINPLWSEMTPVEQPLMLEAERIASVKVPNV